MKERTTRQLVATYDALAAACDHPTADAVLRRVRRSLPRVSLGTVYRNLEKLRAQGRVRVLHLGRGVGRYDAVLTDHDHFLCETCGAVEDIDGLRPAADLRGLRRAGYVVRGARVALQGLCPGCARGGVEGRRARPRRSGGDGGDRGAPRSRRRHSV